jgi:hypothetical protein
MSAESRRFHEAKEIAEEHEFSLVERRLQAF